VVCVPRAEVVDELVDLGKLLEEFRASCSEEIGSIVIHVGVVKSVRSGREVESFELVDEDGRGVEKLLAIAKEAAEKPGVGDVWVFCKVGELKPKDFILYVIASGESRQAAFEAARYALDQIKGSKPLKEVERFGKELRD